MTLLTGEQPCLRVIPDPAATRLWHVAGKRAMDLLLAGAGAVVLGPIMLLIALVIRIDSKGPPLFCQQRVGGRPKRRAGRIDWEIVEFRMLKFRTMHPEATSTLHQAFVSAFVAGAIEPEADDGSAYKLRRDPRVTRVGRWLRATSLDELPQLFNVIAGQMSLVGPRPVPLYEVAGYQDRHLARLAALPGMSGAWQVDGRGRTSFEQMVQMDVEYANHRSLRVDLRLLIRTIPVVILRNGAR